VVEEGGGAAADVAVLDVGDKARVLPIGVADLPVPVFGWWAADV
jgi:hypothetical protein